MGDTDRRKLLLLIGLAQDLQIVSIFKNFNIVHDIDRDRGADQRAGDQNDITNATGHDQNIGIAPTSGNASHASQTLGIRCWFRVARARSPSKNSHACWIGSRNAGAVDWLCFMDADVAADALLIASAVKPAEAEAPFASTECDGTG
jgi:hypothetical protein